MKKKNTSIANNSVSLSVKSPIRYHFVERTDQKVIDELVNKIEEIKRRGYKIINFDNKTFCVGKAPDLHYLIDYDTTIKS